MRQTKVVVTRYGGPEVITVAESLASLTDTGQLADFRGAR